MVKKLSAAERIAKSLEPDETFDPADVDTLGDETSAGRKSFSAFDGSTALTTSKGRLRLRPKVPVLDGYTGKTVNRKEVFGAEEKADAADFERIDEEGESDADEFDGPDIGIGDAAGGFSISADMEEEYAKMMSTTQHELKVMQQPSSEALADREAGAKALKHQLEMWGALVETRIHLEGALTLGHRLPLASSLRADAGTAKEAETASKGALELVASLLSLQSETLKHHGLEIGTSSAASSTAGRPGSEASAWNALDSRVQPVLDWALGVADEWKERTRLDARRSFKVLDQTFRLQMQALSETDPAKLRRRCVPEPGKHQVIGLRPEADDSENGNLTLEDAAEEIFDDRDFYVQLLREVLSNSKGGILGVGADEDRNLRAEIQGRRSAKRKAKAEVERRASKGRKIRYRAIEKLENFVGSRPRTLMLGLGVEEVEPLEENSIEAMLRSLFAPPKASLV